MAERDARSMREKVEAAEARSKEAGNMIAKLQREALEQAKMAQEGLLMWCDCNGTAGRCKCDL